MTGPDAWSRPFLVGALAVLVVVFYASAATHFSYTTDDSYIYFQYARSLSEGGGPAFNEGEPSYGFTGPLWTLILAAGGAVGADIPFAGKALDLLFASIALVVFFFLLLEQTRDVAVSFCGTLAFSVNAWLLRWAGSGLETSLAVLLLLSAFLLLLRNRYSASAAVVGLLTLVRPEGALLLPLLLADLRLNAILPGHALREGTRAVSLWLVIVLPWAAYAYASFGTIVPATFAAKHGGAFDPGEMGAAALDVATTLGSADGVVLACLAVCALLLVRRHRSAPETAGPAAWYDFRQSLVPALWLLLLPLAYVLFTVNVVSRYLLLVTPGAVALAFFALHALTRDSRPALRYGLLLGMTAAVMIQNQVVTARTVTPHVAAFAEGIESCLLPIGSWLRENTPPETVVMTGDVGALGYASRRRICDVNGIVSPGGAAALRSNEEFTGLLRDRAWGRLCVPDYIVHRSEVREELADVPGLVPVLSRPFPGLSISGGGLVHFTLYRVDRSIPAKLLTDGGRGG